MHWIPHCVRNDIACHAERSVSEVKHPCGRFLADVRNDVREALRMAQKEMLEMSTRTIVVRFFWYDSYPKTSQTN